MSENCTICLRKVSQSALDLTRPTCCKHKFHFNCIETWSRTANSCPTCRKRFQGLVVGSGENQKTVQVAETYQHNPQDLEPPLDPEEICSICGSPGRLLICDGCNTLFHTHCVGLGEVVPDGRWECPECIRKVSRSERISVHNDEEFIPSVDHNVEIRTGGASRISSRTRSTLRRRSPPVIVLSDDSSDDFGSSPPPPPALLPVNMSATEPAVAPSGPMMDFSSPPNREKRRKPDKVRFYGRQDSTIMDIDLDVLPLPYPPRNPYQTLRTASRLDNPTRPLSTAATKKVKPVCTPALLTRLQGRETRRKCGKTQQAILRKLRKKPDTTHTVKSLAKNLDLSQDSIRDAINILLAAGKVKRNGKVQQGVRHKAMSFKV